MKTTASICTFALALIAWPAAAQNAAQPAAPPAPSAAPASENSAHQELRNLRGKIVDAISKGDLDGVIENVHPNVVITWQNAEVCRGREGLREFYKRMGHQAFKGYKTPPTPDDLTILYGDDTGVSTGKSVGTYNLLGKTFEFENRWTATVVKENGRWLLAGYHVSLNALDNPIINTAKRSLYSVGGGGALIGLLLGLLMGRRRKAAV
jgi:hypothetical protein